MKFTIGWLKEHLDTKFKDSEIINKCAKKKVKNFRTNSLVISNPNAS